MRSPDPRPSEVETFARLVHLRDHFDHESLTLELRAEHLRGHGPAETLDLSRAEAAALYAELGRYFGDTASR